MTESTEQAYLAQAKRPFQQHLQGSAYDEYLTTIFPVDPLTALRRQYQAATLLQVGAGAVLEWRTPIVPIGFLETYVAMSIFSVAGGASIAVRLFLSVHGLEAGTPQNIFLGRVSVTAGQEISLLNANGSTLPQSGWAYPRDVPSNCHLLLDTTAAAAAGTDLRWKFLRYRHPGPPNTNQVENVTGGLTT